MGGGSSHIFQQPFLFPSGPQPQTMTESPAQQQQIGYTIPPHKYPISVSPVPVTQTSKLNSPNPTHQTQPTILDSSNPTHQTHPTQPSPHNLTKINTGMVSELGSPSPKLL